MMVNSLVFHTRSTAVRGSMILACVLMQTACSDSATQPPGEDPPAAVASVTLDRTTVSLEQAKTSTLSATLRDANGATLTGRTISWMSDATGIATVSSNGLVTAVAVGTANVTATSEGKSATAKITVTPIPVATVTLSTSDVVLEIGESHTVVAETRSATGELLTGRTITWAVADNTVVSVANGVVTALAPGNTTITATSEGQSAMANVVVNAPSCASTIATGRLSGPNAQNVFVYVSVEGWTVTIGTEAMTIVSPAPAPSMYYQLWASYHENVGGKHIKDMLADRRTVLLPGGVIITVNAMPQGGESPVGMERVHWISIYEGTESHRVDMQTHRVVRSCNRPMFGEADEHDGETMRLFFNEEGMRVENIYQQDASPQGVPLPKVFTTVPLAQTSFTNPNQVIDYFDDPRIGHTWW